MLIDELLLPIPNEQDGIAVERCHIALEPNAIGQKDRDRNFVLAEVTQEGVLESLRVIWGHHRSSRQESTHTASTSRGLPMGSRDSTRLSACREQRSLATAELQLAPSNLHHAENRALALDTQTHLRIRM